jgi:hypothetical protein
VSGWVFGRDFDVGRLHVRSAMVDGEEIVSRDTEGREVEDNATARASAERAGHAPGRDCARSALAVIATTLQAIEERAPMYAHAPEALEAQVWMLVWLRQILFGYSDFDIGDASSTFTAALNGGPTSFPLFVVLRDEGMLDQLPRLLGDFGRWVAREWPPVGNAEDDVTRDGSGDVTLRVDADVDLKIRLFRHDREREDGGRPEGVLLFDRGPETFNTPLTRTDLLRFSDALRALALCLPEAAAS